MNGKAAGGKREYTEAEKGVFLARLAANGGNVKKTARETDVSESTLRDWRDGKGVSPVVHEVAEAVKADMARGIHIVMGAVLTAIPGKLADASAAQLGVLFGILADKYAALTAAGQKQNDGPTLPDAERLARLAALFDAARARRDGSAAGGDIAIRCDPVLPALPAPEAGGVPGSGVS